MNKRMTGTDMLATASKPASVSHTVRMPVKATESQSEGLTPLLGIITLGEKVRDSGWSTLFFENCLRTFSSLSNIWSASTQVEV